MYNCPKEFWDTVEPALKNLKELTKISIPSELCTSFSVPSEGALDEIRQSFQQLQIVSSDFSVNISDALKNYMEQSNAEFFQGLQISMQAIQDSITSSIGDSIKSRLSGITIPPLSIDISESLINALDYAEFNTSNEDVIDRIQEIKPELQARKSSTLSFDQMLTIISLLLTIFFEVNSLKPDAQQAEIASQNNILIEQGYEQIELEREQVQQSAQLIELLQQIADALDEQNNLCCDSEKLADALETVNNGSDIINDDTIVIEDGVDVPDDQPDVVGKLIDSNPQPDQTNRLPENNETQ